MLVKFTLIVVSSVFFSAGLGNYILHGILEMLHHRAGFMSRQQQQACSTTKLVRTYFDKNGVKRCVGIKENLRNSQYLVRKRVFFLPMSLVKLMLYGLEDGKPKYQLMKKISKKNEPVSY